MSPVPASAFTIADDKISIDAELPAPRFGQSADADHRSLFALDRIAS